MRLRTLLFVLPILIFTVASASSHHAFSPVYDAKRTITVAGVVTQFRFVNPHAMMLMDVKDKSGKVVKWNVEFAGRLNLEEAGPPIQSSPENTSKSPGTPPGRATSGWPSSSSCEQMERSWNPAAPSV
jgi:Family of unknown function (DUF6152)